MLKNVSLNCNFDEEWPPAPSPSPSLGGKRRHIGEVSISSFLDQCCEELMDKVNESQVSKQVNEQLKRYFIENSLS